jgi:hypothetical protein
LQFIAILFESCFQFLVPFSYCSWWRHTFSFSNWQSLHINLTIHFQFFKLMHFDLMCLQRNLHLHRILCKLHNNFTCCQFISHDRFLIFKNSLVVADFYWFRLNFDVSFDCFLGQEATKWNIKIYPLAMALKVKPFAPIFLFKFCIKVWVCKCIFAYLNFKNKIEFSNF